MNLFRATLISIDAEIDRHDMFLSVLLADEQIRCSFILTLEEIFWIQ
jgi:hypothetical protein